MIFSPLLRFFVQLIDVDIELGLVDTPDPAPPDLDGRELARTGQGIDLGDADVQVDRDVLKRHEARLDAAAGALFRVASRCCHLARIAAGSDDYLDLLSFASGSFAKPGRDLGWT
jgi:hypothetical protein